MKLGYRLENQDQFDGLIRAWSVQEYFKKCGITIQVVIKDVVPNSKKTGIKMVFRQMFRRGGKQDIVQIKQEQFLKRFLEPAAEHFQGRIDPGMQFLFGDLLIPKETALLAEEDWEGNYASPVLLLNHKDYIGFIKPVQEETPYIFTYIAVEEHYKTEYINRFVESRERRQVVKGRYPKNYINAKPLDGLGPEDILSYIFHAEIVITDCLAVLELAVLFCKDFLYMNGGKEEGKAVLMLEQLMLGTHFVYDPTKPIYHAKYQMISRKALDHRLTKTRKAVLKRIGQMFEEADTDKLDACEAPTGITRTGCYGCLACKEICPVHAIEMIEDIEGFLYPVADYHTCIQCGLCRKICIRNKPAVVQYLDGYPKAACARNRNKDSLYGSTSGAIFPKLAEYAINKRKGMVIGVRYGENLFDVVADIAETMEEVSAFYGSKYVKSSFDGIFPKVKEHLENGRFVLYSGLPCECAGLRAYLQKEYENLLVCEILCHSVPSPKVFKRYIKHLQMKRRSKVVGLTFRQKTDTYPRMLIAYQKGLVLQVNYWRNNYFRAFQRDLITRTSCSKCQFVYKKRVGDVTIGDFWGAETVFPDMQDTKNFSFITCNTEKGERIFEAVKEHFEILPITFQEAFVKNHKKSTPLQPEREILFQMLAGDETVDAVLERFNDLKMPKKEEEDPEEQVVKEALSDAAEEDLAVLTAAEKEE